MEQVVNELHRPVRRKYPRRRVIQKGLDDLWQVDLVEMVSYARQNKGYKYMLTVIDTLSKYAWVKGLKSKSAVDVTFAMKSIFKEGRIPKNLQTDDGKEFYNKNFKNLMKNNNINHYSTYSIMKASIVERFNRTLKEKMWKKFSLNGSYKWTLILPNLVKEYNKTKHRTIHMKPIEVTEKNANKVLNDAYNHLKIFRIGKFKMNDYVRISKHKGMFEKGYTPNWSSEIFQIYKIQNTNPITYLIKDVKDTPISGAFYEQELQKVKYPDIYLVEKILKRKKNQVYVKWLGLPTSENSWINSNNVVL